MHESLYRVCEHLNMGVKNCSDLSNLESRSLLWAIRLRNPGVLKTELEMGDEFEAFLDKHKELVVGPTVRGEGYVLRRLEPDLFRNAFYLWLDKRLANAQDLQQLGAYYITNDALLVHTALMLDEFDQLAEQAGA